MVCKKQFQSETGGHVDGVTLFQGHICLLDVFPMAQLVAEPLDLAFQHRGVHRLDLHTKQRLNSFF